MYLWQRHFFDKDIFLTPESSSVTTDNKPRRCIFYIVPRWNSYAMTEYIVATMCNKNLTSFRFVATMSKTRLNERYDTKREIRYKTRFPLCCIGVTDLAIVSIGYRWTHRLHRSLYDGSIVWDRCIHRLGTDANQWISKREISLRFGYRCERNTSLRIAS